MDVKTVEAAVEVGLGRLVVVVVDIHGVGLAHAAVLVANRVSIAHEAAVAKTLLVFETAILFIPAVEEPSNWALDSGAVARRRFLPGTVTRGCRWRERRCRSRRGVRDLGGYCAGGCLSGVYRSLV